VVCFLVLFDNSEVCTHTRSVSFAFRISVKCKIFRFSRLGVVSLPCEWSWAMRLSVTSVLGAQYGTHANVVLAEKF
jgi:hypothetical protein